MPQYDWIETAEFENAIRTRFEQRFSEAGVVGLPFTFTTSLLRLARWNRPTFRRLPTEPMRQMSAGLMSVDGIALSAIALAREARRKSVTAEDIADAIRLLLGEIFPFCPDSPPAA